MILGDKDHSILVYGNMCMIGSLLFCYQYILRWKVMYCFFSGIFKHSQSIAKTYLSDVSPSIDHPKVFGNFNAFSSLGFVIGPLIGGHLAMQSNGFSRVTTLTGFIFLINFFFVWLFVTPVEQVKKQSFTRKEHDAFLAKDNTANNKIDNHKERRTE